jgi:CRISPR-associated endonuclease/helicase Cas3
MSRVKWREITATLMQNTVKVADYLAPEPISRKQILWLGDYFYLGQPEYDESALLRVAIVEEGGDLKALDRGMVNEKYQLAYDDTLGYQADKK